MTSAMRHLRIALPAACLLLIAGGLMFPAQARAQAPPIAWGEPVPLGEDLPSSWFPEIHTDHYGTTRIIWESVVDDSGSEEAQASGGALMITELRDGAWSEPADIYVKDLLNAARPILASDGEYLHLISRSPRNEGRITIQNLSGMYYMRASLNADASNARAWSEAVRLTTGAAYWAQLQVLPDETLVLVYNEMTLAPNGGNRTALFYRRSLDQGSTWSQPARISFTKNRVARSSLVVSPVDGTLILAWDEGYDNLSGMGEPSGIFTAISTDGGETWEAAGQIGEPDADGRRMTFAARRTVEESTLIATNDLTMLVYRATGEDVLLYSLSDDQGRTWSGEQEIPGAIPRTLLRSHHFDKLALASDGDGRIILSYVGQDAAASDGLSVFVMTYEGGKWSSPAVVASPPGFPEYPRLTVAGGNQVHLAFFVRDEAFVDSGHYVVWAISGTTPAAPTTYPPRPEPDSDDPSQLPAGSDDEVVESPSVDTVPYPTRPSAPTPLDRDIDTASPRAMVTRPVIMVTAVTVGALIVLCLGFALTRRAGGF